MNILVVNPYQRKVLRAIEGLEKINVGEVKIIGDEKRILPILSEEKIKLRCCVSNICDNDSIVREARKIIDDRTIIVFGDIEEHYKNRILGLDSSNDINYFYIIDLLELQHFIFVSNYSKKRYLDFEDKRKAISAIFEFMKVLGVKKSNCALITDKKVKSDILEVNLIKMILKDDLAKSINILNPCQINEVFDQNSECNIFNRHINMLVFKNYDITKTFIDTLNIFSGSFTSNNYQSKTASICRTSDSLFVDTMDQKDEKDILFSILLLSKFLSVKSNLRVKYHAVNY